MSSIRTEATAAFLDATRRGEFPLWRCGVCATVSGPQAEQCDRCESTDLHRHPASKDARLVSWATDHQRRLDGSYSPTVLVIGELAEGPWWWSRIIDDHAAEEPLAVGTPLVVDFAPTPDGTEQIPVFRLATPGGAR